jgi:hypothetical protein
MMFQAHVERLLDTKIKCVQSNWGGEYQKLCHQFFLKLGIAHCVSCPHTHQQNGSAERKHRHIVETGRAILAHASAPLKFWGEAFTTATYLINRLSTRVTDNLCPLVSSKHLQIILCSKFLVVHVGLTSDHITSTNFHFIPNHVFSLAIVPFITGTNTLIWIWVVSIFLVM